MTPSQSMTPSAQFASWGSLAEQLDVLVCGSEELQLADDVGFGDTLPAICWAVPGAYATLVDYGA